MHYVIQTDRGFELFGSVKDASNAKWFGYTKPVQVPEGAHYRGRVPTKGVLFTDEDFSSRQFAAMFASAEFAEQPDGSLAEVD